MSRPPLPVGTGGKVTTRQHPAKASGHTWEAYCSFRDTDGRTRKVCRWGPSEQRARRRLAEALRDRVPPSAAELTARSRVADAARMWLGANERRWSTRTRQDYRWVLDCHVLPALGALHLVELRPARLNAYMAELAGRGYSANTQRKVKKVVSGVLGEAVAHEVIPANPTRSMRRIEGTPRRVRALAPAERTDLLARLDGLRCARHTDSPPAATADGSCRMCAAARGDLPALVRTMLGTGCRIGEALALRWCDLDLVGKDLSFDGRAVRVCTAELGPKVTRVAGQGLARQEAGKTAAATRVVPLPAFLVALLSARRPDGATDTDPVFPSGSGTWRDPGSAQKTLRRARAQVGYDWLTSHVLRKTAVTVLDEQGLSARQIADLVGHTRPSLTQDVYMHRGSLAPEAAAALDAAFRPGS